MDKRLANQLIKTVRSDGRGDAFVCALGEGLDLFKRVAKGVQELDDWYLTNIENRLLSQSIFNAVDRYDWESFGMHSEKDQQHSSRRCRLVYMDVVIDIVRDRTAEAKFYDDRCRWSLRFGNDGKRYLLLSYSLSAGGESLASVSLVAPRDRKNNIASQCLFSAS